MSSTTLLLHEARRLGIRGVLQSLFDPQAVASCDAAGIGTRVHLELGGKTDGLHGTPIAIEGVVKNLGDGEYEDPGPTHGGFRYFDDGRRAVVETDDGFTVLLTSHNMLSFKIS